MEFETLIRERRSVRRYKENTPIGHELLVSVLKQAQQAPSWKNLQPARCYVIEDPQILKDFISQTLPAGNQAKAINASAIIVTSFVQNRSGFTNDVPDNELGNLWGAYDLGLRDAYLILAAKNAGLDTLIMGLRDGQKIRSFLNIPENETIASVIAVGYRDEEVHDRPRKDLNDVTVFF